MTMQTQRGGESVATVPSNLSAERGGWSATRPAALHREITRTHFTGNWASLRAGLEY
jgi:hypothetical protein